MNSKPVLILFVYPSFMNLKTKHIKIPQNMASGLSS